MLLKMNLDKNVDEHSFDFTDLVENLESAGFAGNDVVGQLQQLRIDLFDNLVDFRSATAIEATLFFELL